MSTKKITVKGWIVFTTASWREPAFSWWDFKPSASSTEVVAVCEHEIEIEVPEKFDPRPELVKSLEEKKRALSAEFSKRVTEINQQIQNLQALEFDGVSA